MRQDHRPAVTIEHVARAAGVSRATVSRVLTLFDSELVVRQSA